MPSEKRRITLSRRRNTALSQLANSSVNDDEILADWDEASNIAMIDMSYRAGLEVDSRSSGDEPSISNLPMISDDEHEIDSNSDNGLHQYDESTSSRRTLFSRRQQLRRNKGFRTMSIANMSEKFIENLYYVSEGPSVGRLNELRKSVGNAVNNERIQGLILALIVINAIMMGAATFPVVKDNPVISSRFDVVDKTFLVIFTIEAAMQLIYHGFALFRDSFLVFDLAIVALSWALQGIKIARAFRIFRALRLIARIGTMKKLILAVNSVIPRLTGIIMLLLLVMYIFSVIFTSLYKDISMQYPERQQYFVGLPETFFTLFQMMTLDGWRTVFLQAYEEYAWSWLLFVAYIAVTAFVFANLIIAVICDAVHVLGEEDVAALMGYNDEISIADDEPDAAYLASLRNSYTGSHDALFSGYNDEISNAADEPDAYLANLRSSYTGSQDGIGNIEIEKSNSSIIQQLREMETQLNHVVEIHNAVVAALHLLAVKSDVKMQPSDTLFQNEVTSENAHLNKPSQCLGQEQCAVSHVAVFEADAKPKLKDKQLTNNAMKGNETINECHQSGLCNDLQNNLDFNEIPISPNHRPEKTQLNSPSQNLGQEQYAVSNVDVFEAESKPRLEDEQFTDNTREGNEPINGCHQSLGTDLQNKFNIHEGPASPNQTIKNTDLNSNSQSLGQEVGVFEAEPKPRLEEDVQLTNNTKKSDEHINECHQNGLGTDMQNKFNILECLTSQNQRRRSVSEYSEQFIDHVHLITEKPPICQMNQFRKLIGKIVNDDRVQGFILSLIVINAVMMGAATFPVVKENPNISSKFELIDQIFLIAFTIEAAMQFTYHGWTLFKDAFLVFDLTIVALSWALEGVKVARAFRIFRALRLISRIDTMKNLISAVISVIPRLTGILMLLFLVFYIFAVMFTSLFKDVSKQYPPKEQYFVGLPETFFTLFQMMTLDGWKKIFLQAYEEYVWSMLIFVAFICVSAFIFVNLMIAVICDAVHVMGDKDAAGMIGVDEAKIAEIRSADALSPRGSGSSGTLRQKLQELEKDIGEMISMQKRLVSAISIVKNKTRC